MVTWNPTRQAVTGLRPGLRPLRSAEEMALFVQRERVRADRRGLPVSLLVFRKIEGGRVPWRDMTALRRRLQRRLRITDEFGWLDGRIAIAALLADTDADGACVAAEHMLQDAPLTTNWRYEVLTYPEPDNRRMILPFRDHDRNGKNGESGSGDAQDRGGLKRRLRVFTGEDDVAEDADDDIRALDQRLLDSDPSAWPADQPATTDEPVEQTAAQAPFSKLASAPGGMEPLITHADPWWKRTLDIGGAGFGLLLTAPLMLLAAIAVRLSGPGPILFRQQRRGRGGKVFTMLKFRTMVADAERRHAELLALNEQDGPAFKMERDPRVTKVGRILRATSVDELPQLINVLFGDMSLVGPRPLPLHEADACLGWQRQRLAVTPGLTCIWQVAHQRARIPFAEWVRMDIRYIRSRTLWHDLKLVFETMVSILFHVKLEKWSPPPENA